jgi:hypothetical protein
MSAKSHQTTRLSMGKHDSPEQGACVMELASMLEGNRFTDEPESVCPVIRDLLRAYNDRIDDESRQQLYGCAAAAVGSRSTPCVERERLRLCAEAARSVRWSWRSLPTFPAFPLERHAAARAGWALATGHGSEPSDVHDLVEDLLQVGRPAEEPATHAVEMFRNVVDDRQSEGSDRVASAAVQG